ncbi:cytoplasmic dynein 2 intermediate chain 1 [Calliphora vicina]|uniref:cytoplasmic dynein 2 intermediate chain 1 n=1 Tax=Calliphora vicina TaxID=7373 RepID=UPI00325BFBEB
MSDTKVLLRSDVAANKKTLLKKPITKSSTQLKESAAAAEEKEKGKTIKLANVTSTTLNKAKVGSVNKTQPQRSTTGSQQTKILVPRKSVSTSQQKDLPLRAKHVSTSKDIRATRQNYTTTRTNITKIEKKPVNNKPNAVLDTPHNVTVSSPPPQRKNNDSEEIGESNDEPKNNQNNKLIRKGSRTLAPDEIVILKRDSAKKRIEANIQKENMQTEQVLATSLKEPVAFEVKFEEKEKTSRERSRSRVKTNTTNAIDKNDEEHQYSDDFESYESDFETESSTHSLATSEPSSTESENESEASIDNYDEIPNQRDSPKELTDESEDEDDSEVTQNPITVIQQDKERKLDSGHYEMNSRKTHGPQSSSDISMQSTQPITDSLEAFSFGISDQLDSGISTYGTSSPAQHNKVNITYGGYKDFNTKPIINQRGSDLMSKIQFDVLSFTFLDLKPISYDIFMQTFGKLNTNQNFTQTQGNLMHVEQQTELHETRSIWTQHPPQYDLEIIKTLDKNGIYSQNCCGELMNECQTQLKPDCELEQSLDTLKQLNNQSITRNHQNYQKRQRKPINYEHLNSFLLRSSLVIDQILGSSNTTSNHEPPQNSPYTNDQVLSRVTEHFYYIESNLLNTLQVLKVFSNNKYNLLITVHESLPDTNVYSTDFSNLLMVWCTNTRNKPLRLLTTWSEVSKVEISNDSSDIIVASLRDGSIALWDLRETYSFCSKLDGYLTHFAATQSLVPSWCGVKNKSKIIMDLGACLDIKSFRSQSNNLLIQKTFPITQFISLHDSGIVTVWTLVETSETSINLSQMKKHEKLKNSSKRSQTFEYTSPWARVKLMQSCIVNIKDYLETKAHHTQSRFDKTKALFQKDIYSDEALKELNQCSPEMGQQGLRFTSLECGSENVFICTNRNYILMCSKTLKMDKLKRIVIHESRFLFPTALKVLSNEHFLAVGLSNGAVMILNCQSNKVKQNDDKSTSTSALSESESASVPPSRDSTLDINSITGKSCAIQNILLNAQKSYEDMDFDREYRPNTAACIALIDSKQKPFELRIFDQQIIMSGSVLRKNLIQSLELSSDGWRLFALSNGHIRIYDFYLDQEIDYQESQETGKIIDIATGKCGSKENCLMLLKPSTQVEVHILNK